MYCNISLIIAFLSTGLCYLLFSFSVSFLYSTCSVKIVAMKAYGNWTDCNLSEIGFLESKRCDHC